MSADAQRIIETLAKPNSSLPIPEPKKHKQSEYSVFDKGEGLPTQKQQYDVTLIRPSNFTRARQYRATNEKSDWLFV